MGLTARLAIRRIHLLAVAVPGHPLLRLRVEAAVRARGWALADGPGSADALVVCGPLDGELARAVDLAWRRVAPPRARRVLPDAGAIEPALDSIARVLVDDGLQREALRSAPPQAHHDPGAPGRVVLGPVLPAWPAGLVVECTVVTGIVVAVSARLPPGAGIEEDPLDGDARAFVLAGDTAAAILRLCDRPGAARHLRRAVDSVLAGAALHPGRRTVRILRASAERSVLLRWSVGASGAGSEVRALLREALDRAGASAAGEGVPGPPTVSTLTAALVGRPVRAVRLLVAAHGRVAVPDEEPAGDR